MAVSAEGAAETSPAFPLCTLRALLVDVVQEALESTEVVVFGPVRLLLSVLLKERVERAAELFAAGRCNDLDALASGVLIHDFFDAVRVAPVSFRATEVDRCCATPDRGLGAGGAISRVPLAVPCRRRVGVFAVIALLPCLFASVLAEIVLAEIVELPGVRRTLLLRAVDASRTGFALDILDGVVAPVTVVPLPDGPFGGRFTLDALSTPCGMANTGSPMTAFTLVHPVDSHC
jgi:hypothetical protein